VYGGGSELVNVKTGWGSRRTLVRQV